MWPAETLTQQPRRLLALAMIGVAPVEIRARQPVIGGEHDVGCKRQARKGGLKRDRQRVDIGGIVVVGGQRPHRRLPAHVFQCREGGIVSGRRRRRGVLWIERRDQDATAASVSHRCETLADRGLAVAHGEVDDGAIAGKPGAELLCLRPRDNDERAFVAHLVPDLRVGMTGPPRPDRQHDQIEDHPPQRPPDFDDARVGEELLEIAPHRPVVGAGRRAEIDEEHADTALLHQRVARGQYAQRKGGRRGRGCGRHGAAQ